MYTLAVLSLIGCILVLLYMSLNIVKIPSVITEFSEEHTFVNPVDKPFHYEEFYSEKNSDNKYFLFVILSSDCPQCRISFESFWNNVMNKTAFKQITILIKNDDNEIKNYIKLYSQDFLIRSIDDNFLDENNINFMPAFLVVNHDKKVILATPDEYALITPI